MTAKATSQSLGADWGWCSLLPEFVSLALLLLMLKLGFWQWHKSEVKLARQAAYATHASEPVCSGPACLPGRGEAPAFGRQVRIPNPEWAPTRCLLDNQVQQGRSGYLLMMALVEPAVVVLRGWLPMTTRTAQPVFGSLNAHAPLLAEIAHPPATGISWGLRVVPPEPLASGLLRVQYLDGAALQDCFALDLLPYVLRELGDHDDGLARRWLSPVSGAERHQAYAVQWWTMAVVLVLVHLGFRWPRRRPLP